MYWRYVPRQRTSVVRWGAGVSTDYCRQSHVAFATAGMCFVIDKSTAQYSEA